jgi:hypothetical protein
MAKSRSVSEETYTVAVVRARRNPKQAKQAKLAPS